MLLPVLSLAGLVLGSLVLGVTTPTEAAAVGVFGATILALYYRKLTLKTLYASLMKTAQTCGFFFLIIIGAKIFGFLLAYLTIPQKFTEGIAALDISPIITFVMVCGLLLILGCLMDGVSLLLVIVPVVLPALLGIGMETIWIGIVMMITIEMGLTTPPVGMLIFVTQGIGRPYGVTYSDVVKGAFPYIISDGCVVALLFAFPSLALWLPRLLLGHPTL